MSALLDSRGLLGDKQNTLVQIEQKIWNDDEDLDFDGIDSVSKNE